MRRHSCTTLIFLVLTGVAVGCGSSASPATSTPAEADRAHTNYAAMRDKVVLGFAEEFRVGTHAGPLAIAARRLGIVYGPYLGLTCRRSGERRCGEVGIDLVLREDARAVTAWVGGRRALLQTPGLHNGVAGKDWVGYLQRVGLSQPESPFYLPTRHTQRWIGSPPVDVPVRLKIVDPDDSTRIATLPRVFLSPGWG